MGRGLNDRQSLLLRRQLELGLPLVAQPYLALARLVNADEAQVIEQMQQWQNQGLFRRVGLVLNHRVLGFAANAMLVLDIPDAFVDEIGQRLGQTPGITLCYRRPRLLPEWRYNLFCMVHGRQRDQVQSQIETLLQKHLLSDMPHQLLFSTHAFKQCGGRFVKPDTGELIHG